MKKEKLVSFLWQHLLLLISLLIMTFGVALCVRSMLGSSVISTVPYVMTMAGADGMAPELTIGDYTCLMNIALVLCQLIVLRHRFEPVQLFQLLIGFVFGLLLDFNMWATSAIPLAELWQQILAQVSGCTVLGFGIVLEVRCGSITMPGEGMPAALSKITGKAFAGMKIVVDITLVVISVVLGYVFFGRWCSEVIGPGTLFAMIYVGVVVRFLGGHLHWFERMLCYRPGFRRYIYGLARYIARVGR